MSTRLNKLGYLPGQKPKSFFGKPTPPEQPYAGPPWNISFNSNDELAVEWFYDESTVDWILVQLFEANESKTEICSIPALIQSNGRVIFIDNSPCYIPDTGKEYVIGVGHRNHLPVVSDPIRVQEKRLIMDFNSLDGDAAKNAGLKCLPGGANVMYAGNGDQVSHPSSYQVIDEHDLELWQAENGKNSSYLRMDLDLNGDVTVRDKEILFSNYGQRVVAQQ